MTFYGVLTDHQSFSDLAVRQTIRNQFKHIEFALGQIGKKTLLIFILPPDVL